MTLPGISIRLLHPEFLLLIPVAIFLAAWRLRWRRPRTAAVRFSDLRHVREAGRSWRLRLRPMLTVLRLSALALFCVAMARPQYGWSERRIESYGVDIMIALDVSGSMQLQDFNPNRLEAAKAVTARFLDRRKYDRIGVVIFGNTAFTLCPLTLDYGVIKDFIGRLTFERLHDQRTALGLGLATAVDRLKDSDAKSKVVILVTDGVDTVGKVDPRISADVAKGLKVRVYTIGVGSQGRTLVPVQTMFGRMFQPQGAEFDEALLKAIAEKTGAKYYGATDEKKLEEIYEEIDKLETSKAEYTEYNHYSERMEWVLVPALLLLLLEVVLRNTWLLKLP